jgi:hypothetical protein
MFKIEVLQAFTEGRSQKSYKPGELITDPQWHDPADRRRDAYAARGLVRVTEIADEPAAMSADIVSTKRKK